MGDSLVQNLFNAQTGAQPLPVTIASTTVIAPETFITFVSGTIDIATITPYVAGQHMIVLIPTDASPGDLLTTGNILVGSTTLAQNVPMLLVYDPIQAKYYVK